MAYTERQNNFCLTFIILNQMFEVSVKTFSLFPSRTYLQNFAFMTKLLIEFTSTFTNLNSDRTRSKICLTFSY